MNPWYEPLQIIAALGVTGPFLILYAYRVYSKILEHRGALQDLAKDDWIDRFLPLGWNRDELSTQLALNSVYLEFDQRLGSVRRSLRSDVYAIILIGFIGTLTGMLGAFTTLLLSVGSQGLDPAHAVTSLIRGGLSMALVSSLIAAIIAAIVMGYLSFTEIKPVVLKARLNRVCFERYGAAKSRQD